MLKGRGKGKISYDLAAASCAAVLAVYAAGYSRTRDAARRFETHARERRPVVPATPPSPAAEPAAASPGPAVIEAPVPAPGSAHEAATVAAVAVNPAPRSSSPATVRKPAPKPIAADAALAAQSSSPGGLPQIMSVPLPAADAVAQPIAIRRDPAFAAGAKWRDGTYTGLGYSAHGDIEARVVIRDGRIVEAGIASCGTRYPCDVIDPLIHQPVERQSPDVDYMSHATESSDAYYDGLVAALTEASEKSAGNADTPK